MLGEIEGGFEALANKVSTKSAPASAMRYALTRYRDDGHIEIAHGAAERALRAVALGRKNYLFAGSERPRSRGLPARGADAHHGAFLQGSRRRCERNTHWA
jgi:hypothetical protein